MVENWNAVPHVTQFDEVDITSLNELRKKFSGAYEKKGAKLTLTPLVIKAVVAALKYSALDRYAMPVPTRSEVPLKTVLESSVNSPLPAMGTGRVTSSASVMTHKAEARRRKCEADCGRRMKLRSMGVSWK